MHADRTLSGKNAFVTGATSGIGLAIAERLAAAGCNIGMNGFGDEVDIIELVERISAQYDVYVAHYRIDLNDVIDIESGFDAFRRDIGRIDILVNNAGVQHVCSFADFPVEKWDQIIAVNLSAVFHCSKFVIKDMVANQWGRIVNVASVHGLVGSIDKSAYVAAKHGVVGLTKSIALEYAKSGVTCNAICPGYADTAIIRKQVEDKSVAQGQPNEEIIRAMLSDKHPSGKFIDPTEIAALTEFLCSDQASGITGTALSIDGGWSAQ